MPADRVRDLKLCALAVGVMAVLAALHVIAPDVPALRRLELGALDAQMRVRGARPPGPEVVVVMIDDRTIAELGQWPPPRQALAQLVDTLHRAGAKAIGIDILFADPSPRDAGRGDVALAQSIAEAGNVVLPFTFEFGTAAAGASPASTLVGAAYSRLSSSGDYRPLPLVPHGIVAPLAPLAARASLGHMLVAFDVDGAPRYDYPALAYDAEFYPSMAVRLVQAYLDVPWSAVGLELGRGVALGGRYVPTDAQMRLLVDYLGPPGAFPTHSLLDVLQGRVPSSAFSGRIVLIGASVAGAHDTFPSPFSPTMPGVERLATVVDSILHDRHLQRPSSSTAIEIGAMLAASILLGFVVSRASLATAFVSATVLAALFAASAHVALTRHGMWMASGLPALSVLVTFIALSLYRYGLLDGERRHMRRVFGRYLAPQMVDRLVAEKKLPELGGEQRELTVLFSDLRGFTTMSERLDPATLTSMINAFLSAATEAVLEHGGTVDKYIGDCIMAFWNAPLDQPDHARMACRAALRIIEKVDALDRELAGQGHPHLVAGIGINTGPCTVGNFGSTRRLEYSAVGDAVNVASRLEGETKNLGFKILIGPETAARVADFAIIPLDRIRVRGRLEAIDVHALVGDASMRETAAFREMLERAERASA
jgi:adenylate cyclase